MGIGCSKQVPFEIVPVSGRIHLPQPFPTDATVTIHFEPEGGGANGENFPRPAQGVVQADGVFSALTTNSPNDGAIPGRYRVTLSAIGPQYRPLPHLIPNRYARADVTPWQVEIRADAANEIDLTWE